MTDETNQPPEIGPFLKSTRIARGLTLDDLAQASKVSKSMISQVERGEANPTFAVLWSITKALEIDIADITQLASADASQHLVELTGIFETPLMRSQDGRCVLRILSPPQMAGRMEWYDVQIEPGGALESSPHALRSEEHLTVLEGELEVSVGEDVRRVSVSETARYPVDRNHRISNVTQFKSRALMVLIYNA